MEFLRELKCRCGRVHRCDIESVCIEQDSIERIPALLKGYEKALLVSDANTRPLAFERVQKALHEGGIAFREAFFDQTKVLVPDEAAVGYVESALRDLSPDGEKTMIIGIGSGVINDICKWVSFRHGLSYMIIATAPSMDGYASSVAAMTFRGMKDTQTTHTPAYILADPRILALAPLRMIQSGLGDILGKDSCLNDWKLSALLNEEYFCPELYRLVEEELSACQEIIEGCIAREEKALGRLMESLVKVGIYMSYAGNSRPASGSEHHMAHFFEITGLIRGHHALFHGEDVVYSTYYTAWLRQALAGEQKPGCGLPGGNLPGGGEAAWEDPFAGAFSQERESIFGPITQEVVQLQQKTGFYQLRRRERLRELWPQIREILLQAKSPEQVKKWLERLGCPLSYFEEYYGKDIVRESFVYAKDLKDRYTVFNLAQELGELKSLAKRL